MSTGICPACGCSLARLGIDKARSIEYTYGNQVYRFCCQGCVGILRWIPKDTWTKSKMSSFALSALLKNQCIRLFKCGTMGTFISFVGALVAWGSTALNRDHAAIAIIGCSFCLGGRPRRLDATQGGKGTVSSNSSCRVQRWSVNPAVMAGVRSCHFRGAFSGAASRRRS